MDITAHSISVEIDIFLNLIMSILFFVSGSLISAQKTMNNEQWELVTMVSYWLM